MVDANADSYCGRVQDVPEPVVTDSPTDSPTYAKDYIITADTKCDVVPNQERATRLTQFTSQDECQLRCSGRKNCKAYQWNGKRNVCIIFKYRLSMDVVVAVKSSDSDRVCAIVPKNTPSPTATPTTTTTEEGTNVVTEEETAEETEVVTEEETEEVTEEETEVVTEEETEEEVEIVMDCTLRALLKFDFDSPNDAAYYGYHADYMEVTMDEDETEICSSDNQNDLPAWCTYENSSPDGDSAYVANVDDWFDADELTTEKIKIFNAAGRTVEVYVSHWFFGKDYYPHWEEWDDHMLAAVLKIKNMSSGTQNQLNSEGWSHPVDMNTPTHDSNGDINKDYQGNFKVTVTCDDSCFCDASFELV